jgi:hypothetical protein
MPVVNAGVVSAQAGQLRLSDVSTSGTFGSPSAGTVVFANGISLTGDTTLTHGAVEGLLTSGDSDLTVRDTTLTSFQMAPSGGGSGRLVLLGQTTVDFDTAIYPGIEVVVPQDVTLDLGDDDLVVAGTVSVAGSLVLRDGAMVRPLSVPGAAPSLAIATTGRLQVASSGTAWVQVPLQNAGTVEIASGGSLLVDAMTMAPTAIFTVHLAPTGAGRLTSSQTVALNGTLGLVRDGGFVPTGGSSYTLLEAGHLTGAFSGLTGQSAGGGNVFSPLVDDTSVSVVVNAA